MRHNGNNIDDIFGFLKDGGKIETIMNAVLDEEQAHKMASMSANQLDSLIVDGWNEGGTAFTEALKDVDKVISHDREIISYGKAIAIARHRWEHRFYDIRSHWKHKLKYRTSKSYRQQSDMIEEMMINAITYFVLMRIKQDILDRYELPGKARKSAT